MLFPSGYNRFDGFGVCALAANLEPPLVEISLPRDDRTARRMIRRHCLPQPGVYGMLDAEGELIYVGKSKSLRDRLLSYFTKGDPQEKCRRIVRHAKSLVWEPAPHEFAALLRELELIRRWQPRFNVKGRRRRRRACIVVGHGPAPYVYLSATPAGADDLLFGPVRGNRHDRHVVRLLNDCFRLRDCPEKVPIVFADQLRLFVEQRTPRCIRSDLGTCLAPCAAGCTRAEYDQRVRAAVDFLRGADDSLLERLEHAMHVAAAARQFEQAALVRDVWTELRDLRDRLQRMREIHQHYSFVYPLPGYGRGEIWYLLDRGDVAAAAPSPRGRRSARQCLRMLEHVYPNDAHHAPDELPEDLEVVVMVAAWFRANPDELKRAISPESARRRAQDSLEQPVRPR